MTKVSSPRGAPHPRPTEQLLARRALSFGETIFSEISALALAHEAVNLGQGFPDFDPPDFVLDAARAALAAGNHQYARSAGLVRLVEVIAEQLAPALGRRIDPLAEVTVTVGATEALLVSTLALVNPGDEVIMLEPFYDAYPADVSLSGGIPRFLPLHPDAAGRWSFDGDELRRLFSSRTKLIYLNTPHNPTGKVFTRAELELLAELCLEHDAVAVCDEVYDKMCFDEHEHLHLAALPGMEERTVTIFSAGKTFSATGWKIGWIAASPALSTGIRRIHQWVPFAVATPLQEAVALALAEAPQRDYYRWLREMYQGKRDQLAVALQRAGFRPLIPEGTYFIMADSSDLGFDDDITLCRYLTTEAGVAAIPPSAFYCPAHQHLARHLVRFCFCKRDETLQLAAQRLSERLPGPNQSA